MDHLFHFTGGDFGAWTVLRQSPVRGESLAAVKAITVAAAGAEAPGATRWTLRGVVSNERYVTREERDGLRAVQEGLGRPSATCGALIPIRKNPAWWGLAQDERRAILEERSRHIRIGLAYLPAVARKLYHCRDLGEPFDFLTWFEYAPQAAAAFEDLVGELRASEEWQYVDREVDFRLIRP